MSGETQPLPPCRLSFILARAAPVGVIFRRGPSQWVRIIRWHTRRDEFERGHWFRGRIYEDSCDLSPDGSRLIYHATKMWRQDAEVGPSWTAISRPPYLTALALWRGHGACAGGGLFESDGGIIVTNPRWLVKSIPNVLPADVRVTGVDGMTDTSFFDFRHRRDGWSVTAGSERELWRPALPESAGREPRYVLEKPHPSLPIRLVLTQGGSENAIPYSLLAHGTGKHLPLDVACADWDFDGRLVYAQEGKIFAGSPDTEGQFEPVELADFNDDRPESIPTPDWATRWSGPDADGLMDDRSPPGG